MIKHLFKWIFNIQSPTIWYLTFHETSSYRDYYTITRKVRKKYDIGYQAVKAFEKGLSYERVYKRIKDLPNNIDKATATNSKRTSAEWRY